MRHLCSAFETREQLWRKTPCTDLSPLGPEWRVQLAVRKQTVLQTREKLEQVASSGEAKRRPLDPILTDQHHRPPAVNYGRNTGDDFFV